jgi:hypothetical protein
MARLRSRTELEWVPTPAWVLGGDAEILTPAGDGPRGDDTAAMTKVIRGDYVTALKVAVATGELRADYLEPETQARSWARFVAYREGDHGPHPCSCSSACIAKLPKAPPRPSAGPAVEAWPQDTGPRQRRDLEAERSRDDEREAERQRLLKIANEAGIRYFT